MLSPPDTPHPDERPVVSDDIRISGGLNEMLDEWERGFIKAALADAKGNVAEAARVLKTDRANLYRRRKRLGIDT
jgi:anaerobic nitric oxide reductase transcription regulator